GGGGGGGWGGSVFGGGGDRRKKAGAEFPASPFPRRPSPPAARTLPRLGSAESDGRARSPRVARRDRPSRSLLPSVFFIRAFRGQQRISRMRPDPQAVFVQYLLGHIARREEHLDAIVHNFTCDEALNSQHHRCSLPAAREVLASLYDVGCEFFEGCRILRKHALDLDALWLHDRTSSMMARSDANATAVADQL